MIIQVDWFKDSGKWYSGTVVEIPDDCHIWSDNFKQEIVNNQDTMMDGWQNSDYYVVTRSHAADELSPNSRSFYHRLFNKGDFKGIKKEIKSEKSI